MSIEKKLFKSVALFKQGKLKECLKINKRLADEGYKVAQYNCAVLYYRFFDKKQKGIEYLKKSAAQNLLESSLYLIAIYIYDEDNQNIDAATELMNKWKGPIIDFYRGLVFEIKKDYDSAINYYEKSANVNCWYAQQQLGILYYKIREYDKAEKLLRITAELGKGHSQFYLAVMLTNIHNEEALKNIENVEEAIEWCKKIEINDEGIIPKKGMLGIMHYKLSFVIFNKLDAIGDPTAKFALENFYPKDNEKDELLRKTLEKIESIEKNSDKNCERIIEELGEIKNKTQTNYYGDYYEGNKTENIGENSGNQMVSTGDNTNQSTGKNITQENKSEKKESILKKISIILGCLVSIAGLIALFLDKA